MKFTKTCKNDPDLNQCDRGLTVVAQRCLAIDDASDQDRSWPEADLSGCLRRGPFLTPTDVAWDKNGRRMKIFRAAEAFYARRREGPFRFIQNRSRTSAVRDHIVSPKIDHGP